MSRSLIAEGRKKVRGEKKHESVTLGPSRKGNKKGKCGRLQAESGRGKVKGIPGDSSFIQKNSIRGGKQDP